MPDGGAVSGERSECDVGHGPADHGFGVTQVAFVDPEDEAAGESLVRPDQPYRRMVQTGPQQRPSGAVTVLDAGRDDVHGQQ